MAIYQLGDIAPDIHETAYIVDGATVIGNVELKANTSVWFGATLRGDTERISIGERSNLQEGVIVHTDKGYPLTVGSDVTVGHQAMLHGCTIGDGSLIGIGAVVLNDAVIGRNCIVGAGSLVTEGKSFPDGSMIMGTPAKAIKTLTPEQIAGLARSAASYVENAKRHRNNLTRLDGASPDVRK